MNNLAQSKPVQILAALPADPPPGKQADARVLNDAAQRGDVKTHPTRRDDDRPPNPRTAERALARDLGLPGESLEGLLDPE